MQHVSQVPAKDKVSIEHCFQEFIKGIDTTDLFLPEYEQNLATTAWLQKAWRPGCVVTGGRPEQALEEIQCWV